MILYTTVNIAIPSHQTLHIAISVKNKPICSYGVIIPLNYNGLDCKHLF